MKEVEISVDIYGVWEKEPLGYRIYIDDEMMCERGFYAMEYEFYRDKMIVELEPGIEHTFKFEQLSTIHQRHMLSYKNLLLNGEPVRPTFTVPN
jgi:hypothetical protein